MAVAGQNSRLGRGLASLMGDMPQQSDSYRAPMTGTDEQRNLPIETIKPSTINPRRDFADEELAELADSIRQKGVVQPLIVRPLNGTGPGYEIVAGERRWRAAQIAKEHSLPVIIKQLSDREALEIAIIENVQRTDLNAIEEAGGYQELIERFDYKQEELARVIGKSRSHLANMLRLLKLPSAVQNLVRDGKLSVGHARPLIGQEDAVELAEMIVERGMNVREVEALIQKRDNPGADDSVGTISEADANILKIQGELEEILGLKVSLKQGPNGSGDLVIKYKTLEQFEDVYHRLTGGMSR